MQCQSSQIDLRCSFFLRQRQPAWLLCESTLDFSSPPPTPPPPPPPPSEQHNYKLPSSDFFFSSSSFIFCYYYKCQKVRMSRKPGGEKKPLPPSPAACKRDGVRNMECKIGHNSVLSIQYGGEGGFFFHLSANQMGQVIASACPNTN